MFCILIQLFNRYGRRKKDTNNRTYRQKIRSKALLCRRVKYQQNSTQSRSIELAIIFASLARIAIRMIDFSDRVVSYSREVQSLLFAVLSVDGNLFPIRLSQSAREHSTQTIFILFCFSVFVLLK